MQIEPIAGVRVLVERHLTDLLARGATLVWRRGILGRHLALSLAHPELWIEFLDSHPSRR